MKNINLNLDLKSLASRFKNDTALVFYAALAIVFFFEIFIIFGAIRHIVLSRAEAKDIIAPKDVRLDFAEYEQAVKRIEAGKEFYPGEPIFENPFVSK
ncbi:MAG: hypothetical protein UZ12_BCD005000604 [Bacteroidetes bacterium OLB12]|nr:MAG: hypothetical protein UZ12_BCD005000604 [Bacteroidetes bacterium OLB12]